MFVYIFGRFTFKILGHALLLWFNVCFFTQKYCYLFLSLFISITIIFTIISIINVIVSKYIITNFHYCNYLPIFTIVTTHILTLYWFQIWFPFCQCFLPKLYAIIFCWFFKPQYVPLFFSHSFFGCHN